MKSINRNTEGKKKNAGRKVLIAAAALVCFGLAGRMGEMLQRPAEDQARLEQALHSASAASVLENAAQSTGRRTAPRATAAPQTAAVQQTAAPRPKGNSKDYGRDIQGKWLQAGQYDRKTGKYNASGTHYEGFDRVFEWWIDEETLSFVQRINGEVVLKQTEHYVVTGDTLFNKDSLFTGTIDIDGDELRVTTDNWITVFTRIE